MSSLEPAGLTAPVSPDLGSDGPDPHRWRALTVCLIAGFMTLLDVSIVNVALPSIRTGLEASASDLQWVLSGYALTYGLVLVPAGRLGDARGRRMMFMVALGLFTLTSAAAGLAPAAGYLVAARLLQGAAGGLLYPQVAGLIQQMFRGAERGTAFGLLGATIGVSTAVGPLLGGLIINAAGAHEGWRWIFFVNVPVGIAALALCFRVIPPPLRTERGGDLDPLGVGLLGSGVVLLLLPFVEEQQWHGSMKWALLPAAAVVLSAFVAWERRYSARGRQPVADLALLRVHSYAFGCALALVYFAGFTSVFFTYTLYVQQGLHYSALMAGAAVTPFALGSAVSAGIGGRTVDRHGRRLVTVGLLMVAVGLVATYAAVDAVPGDAVGLVTAGPLLLAGLGSGLVISPNQTLTLAEVPVRVGGSAAGVLQTGQRVGSAVGIAAVGSVFFSSVASPNAGWDVAFRDALLVIVGFVVLALVIAIADLLANRGRRTPNATVSPAA